MISSWYILSVVMAGLFFQRSLKSGHLMTNLTDIISILLLNRGCCRIYRAYRVLANPVLGTSSSAYAPDHVHIVSVLWIGMVRFCVISGADSRSLLSEITQSSGVGTPCRLTSLGENWNSTRNVLSHIAPQLPLRLAKFSNFSLFWERALKSLKSENFAADGIPI